MRCLVRKRGHLQYGIQRQFEVLMLSELAAVESSAIHSSCVRPFSCSCLRPSKGEIDAFSNRTRVCETIGKE